MGRALYRKHRPKSLQEVVGQDHITTTLERAIKEDRISHAYLLTGPRGVGKTSVARILAHQINGLEYSDDTPHIDIIEIDAASNRRIDEIRDLRDKVYIAPVSAKYKVYIIDEVHMLTREAFNALLKTLEEPPAHIVFILATTDAHKLPDTIVSRTQRFSFRPISVSSATELLSQMAQAEKINISSEALKLLAEHGQGSFRDSISLLDQIGSQGSFIEVSDIERLLGLPPEQSINQLAGLLSAGTEPRQLMSTLNDLYDNGYQAPVIAKKLGQNLRQTLVENNLSMPADNALNLLHDLVDVPASADPETTLEVALLKNSSFKTMAAAVPLRAEPMQKAAIREKTATPVDDKSAKPLKPIPKTVKKAGAKALNAELWAEVLKAIKQKYNTLYGILRMAQPDFSKADQGILQLTFAFNFHQKRLGESSNYQKLAAILQDLTGQNIEVECLVDKSVKPETLTNDQEQAEAPASPDVKAISNIFGQTEVLES